MANDHRNFVGDRSLFPRALNRFEGRRFLVANSSVVTCGTIGNVNIADFLRNSALRSRFSVQSLEADLIRASLLQFHCQGEMCICNSASPFAFAAIGQTHNRRVVKSIACQPAISKLHSRLQPPWFNVGSGQRLAFTVEL